MQNRLRGCFVNSHSTTRSYLAYGASEGSGTRTRDKGSEEMESEGKRESGDGVFFYTAIEVGKLLILNRPVWRRSQTDAACLMRADDTHSTVKISYHTSCPRPIGRIFYPMSHPLTN
ncbi:hypothetical protein PoB_004749700 [Plakobranchus ocellatus]|uniref:Uncharacterized protein n=1 Tax=Plakobranchus ocellatus TaxID=259542 RepID=A0AAV4BNQ1_9GAST|nr:hypothetical protein PoB_004749700 [Plakobranchus ocellatus]